MISQKIKLIVILFSDIGLIGLQAQEAIPAAGGNSSGSGGSTSYTVGQIVYTTNTGINGSVSQGSQQPFEISVITGIERFNGISLNYMAYPNPTIDFLTLKVENFEKENLFY